MPQLQVHTNSRSLKRTYLVTMNTSSKGQAKGTGNDTLQRHQVEYDLKLIDAKRLKQSEVSLIEEKTALQKLYNDSKRLFDTGKVRLEELDEELHSKQAAVDAISNLVQSGTTHLDEWKNKDMALLLGNTKEHLQKWVLMQTKKSELSGRERRQYHALYISLKNDRDLDDLRLFHAHYVHADDIVALLKCIPELQVFGLSSLDDTERIAFTSFLAITVQPFIVAKVVGYARPNVTLPTYPLSMMEEVLNGIQLTPAKTLKSTAATPSSVFSQFSHSSSGSSSKKRSLAALESEERHLFMDDIPMNDKDEARIADLIPEHSQKANLFSELVTETDELRLKYNDMNDQVQTQQTTIAERMTEITRLEEEYEALEAEYAPVKRGLRQLYERCQLRDDWLDFGNVLGVI